MDVDIANNTSGSLYLAFFDWGYKTPAATKSGTSRRRKRESDKSAALAVLYADTPKIDFPSRQVFRRLERFAEKAAARRARVHSGEVSL